MIARAQTSNSVSNVPMDDASPPAAPEPEPAPTLPSPDYVSGDPLAMIAKLFVKSAQQKRRSDDLTAKSQEQAEDAADAARINAMKEKADRALCAGIAGGLSQVAAGGCLLVGGLKSAGALDNAPKAQSISSKWEGASMSTAGLGKVAEASLKHHADAADQDIAKAESDGKLAKRAQDALRKEVDAASQHESKVTQLLQEIKQSQAQCERAALLRI
jgi:hypothetical protein